MLIKQFLVSNSAHSTCESILSILNFHYLVVSCLYFGPKTVCSTLEVVNAPCGLVTGGGGGTRNVWNIENFVYKKIHTMNLFFFLQHFSNKKITIFQISGQIRSCKCGNDDEHYSFLPVIPDAARIFCANQLRRGLEFSYSLVTGQEEKTLQTYFLYISNFSHDRGKDLLVSQHQITYSLVAWLIMMPDVRIRPKNINIILKGKAQSHPRSPLMNSCWMARVGSTWPRPWVEHPHNWFLVFIL